MVWTLRPQNKPRRNRVPVDVRVLREVCVGWGKRFKVLIGSKSTAGSFCRHNVVLYLLCGFYRAKHAIAHHASFTGPLVHQRYDAFAKSR
jgi:hypothetical protein